jgi:hypothetical protein
MKKLATHIILPVLCLVSLSTKAAPIVSQDSTKITHTIDGSISEWKADKFETDKETSMQYAIDHDKDNFYFAVKVPDQRLQMKMIGLGMELYIDKKGKKKEGTGIEFPIKKEGGFGGGFGGGGRGGGREGGDQNGGSQQRPDPKEMRDRLASTMILLKTFGMEDQEDKQQLIVVENGVNIAFDWDESNALIIEYLVPVKFISSPANLSGKPLGIGWKINGIEIPSSGMASSNSSAASIPGGRGGGGGSRTGSGAPPPRAGNVDFNSSDSRMKEQSYWTKYTANF